MTIKITRHAEQRFQERFSNPLHSIRVYAKRAMDSEMTSQDLEVIKDVSFGHYVYKLYGGYAFVFKREKNENYTLVTLFPVTR